MSDKRTVIESRTANESSAIVSVSGFAGLVGVAGVVGITFQLGGVATFSWKMLGLGVLFVLFALIAFASIFMGRRTVVDHDEREVQVRPTALGVALPFLGTRIELDDITEVALSLEIPPDNFMAEHGFHGTVVPTDDFRDDRYIIAIEMGMEQVEVELADFYPGARERAEKLAGAIGVMLVDTATDKAIHTPPEELSAR